MEKEMFKAVIAAGQGAIKSVFLLNGGACVALLTLLTRSDITPEKINWPLSLFGAGIFFAAFVSGVTYVSQAFFHREFWARKYENLEAQRIEFRRGTTCQVIGVGGWILSLVCFGWGCWELHSVFG